VEAVARKLRLFEGFRVVDNQLFGYINMRKTVYI